MHTVDRTPTRRTPIDHASTDRTTRRWPNADPARWVALAAPLLVSLVVLWHPLDPTSALDLADRSTRWIWIHVGLLAVLPLLAAAVWYLLSPIQNRAATVSRIMLAPALVLYSSFDSLVGLGTGVLVREASAMTGQGADATELVEHWWSVPSPIGLISALAQVSWLVVLGAAAIAHAQAGSARRLVVALTVATVAFPFLHVPGVGLVSMAGLALAVMASPRVCRVVPRL